MATQLKTRVKYQPGKEHETLLTGTFTPESGVEKYVGLFDLDSYADATVDGGIQNGVCLVVGATEADIHLQLYNEKIKKIDVVRADWNIDKLDGNGTSGIILDLNYSQIFGIALEWLGVGSVVYVLNIYGANVPLHQVDNANLSCPKQSRGVEAFKV